jgi:hypothetical protein
VPLYSLRLISNQAEGTFGRLRYVLGGDRPSQTTRLLRSRSGSSPASVSAPHWPGWCSIGALLGLPPTLYRPAENTIAGCSKAPRGLSVLSWVTCIFTGATISPSLSLRQRSSRYAIRAGRNLPDKEFRYLRTVIVTAATHQGFSSKLLPCGMTSPFNLLALGRRQPLYRVFRLGRDLCFC